MLSTMEHQPYLKQFPQIFCFITQYHWGWGWGKSSSSKGLCRLHFADWILAAPHRGSERCRCTVGEKSPNMEIAREI